MLKYCALQKECELGDLGHLAKSDTLSSQWPRTGGSRGDDDDDVVPFSL